MESTSSTQLKTVELYRHRLEEAAKSEILAKLRSAVTDLSLPRSGDMGQFDVAFGVDRGGLVRWALKKLLEEDDGSSTGV